MGRRCQRYARCLGVQQYKGDKWEHVYGVLDVWVCSNKKKMKESHLHVGIDLVDDALDEVQRQRLHQQKLNAVHRQLRALRYCRQRNLPLLRRQAAQGKRND